MPPRTATLVSERRSPSPELARLRARLAELEETLRAIRSGEVDALVVETDGEAQVFTLMGADQTYRLMVEEMQQGAATLSLDGVVLYCNPFLAVLLDVPVAAILGAPLTGFLDESTTPSLEALLRGARTGGSRGAVSFRRGAGRVPTHVSLTLLPLESAPVLCLIVTDMTEREGVEQERAELAREQVARAAAEEANRIAQGEIERRKSIEASLHQAEQERSELLRSERVARSEAEEANRLKDEFLATLSHEMRTPLSAIVAWAHVLLQPGLDLPSVERAAQAIDRNARAQTRLVSDLLDVSRIVTGQFQMNVGPVRLADVIEAAADTVRSAAQARSIRLELSLDGGVEPVLGDASRLQQVAWNLLSNAIRLAPVGGLVQVRVESVGPWVQVSVTDDGAGIDPAFLPFMFDRFRQADSSSTRKHAGLGLGLAIVRHLVELHGGSVEARNRKGGPGAEISVRLPRPRASIDLPTQEAVPTRAAAGEGADPASLKGVSVLLVDDEEDTREALAIGLRGYGARVATAASAAEGFALLERTRPDVLVADIGMPGEDGHALLRRIRSLPPKRGGTTPALALTAYASAQDRLDAFESGFQRHLAKPATPAELASVVASLVAHGLLLPT